MKMNEIESLIADRLSRGRYEHSLRVAMVALDLAERWNGNKTNVHIAALFHDFYKDDTNEYLKELIKHYNLPLDLLQYNAELWHGPVAAEVVKHQYAIHDQEIYQAIYYHTTGRAEMTWTEKIVFIADYIEPHRQFPGLEMVRELAMKNMDQAIYLALQNTIDFLKRKQVKIHPCTLEAHNYYKKIGSE